MAHNPIRTPPCIRDGKPPCPTCPVRFECWWAGEVLEQNAALYVQKVREVRKEAENGVH